MTQKTCAERVRSEWKNEKARLKFWADNGPDAREDDGNGSDFWEYGLGFDYVAPDTIHQPEGYFRFQISWGGPSDEIRLFADRMMDGGWSLYRAEYWFLDWFDGASLTVTDEFEVRWLFNLLDELGSLTAEFEKAAA